MAMNMAFAQKKFHRFRDLQPDVMEQRTTARVDADSIRFFLNFEHFCLSIILPASQRILLSVTVRDHVWHFFAIFDPV
jgi:hypothetical protein